jgi:fluoride exporter
MHNCRERQGCWERLVDFSRSFGHDQMSSEQLRVDAQPSIGRKVVLGTAALSAIAALVSAFADAMSAYFWVAIGSALGGMARHWCTSVATAWFGAKFPWGTLFINISGSFVIGFFFAISGPNGRFDASTNVKIFVMTGLCGGYTTFSAFSLQTLSLFQQGDWFRGSGYIGASVLLCVVGVWAGYALATAINPASSSGW